jgi:hypothetical protein
MGRVHLSVFCVLFLIENGIANFDYLKSKRVFPKSVLYFSVIITSALCEFKIRNTIFLCCIYQLTSLS